MRKIYTTLLIALVNISAFAQPVLNSSDLEAVYNLDRYRYDGDTSSYSDLAAGANQTWDFSTIVAAIAGNVKTVPFSSAPNSQQFPAANYCYYSLDTTQEGNNIYVFANLTSSKYELIGFGTDQFALGFSDSQIYFTFPYTYGTVIDDTRQISGFPTSDSYLSTYDAYGTLITPYETHTNVIRRKEVNQNNEVSYLWFKTNPYTPIMELKISNNGYIDFYINSTLSITKSEAQLLSVYPNPANNVINISTPNNKEIDSIIITDLTGKTVIEQNNNSSTISVQNLSNGIYFVKAFSKEQVFQAKIVKN